MEGVYSLLPFFNLVAKGQKFMIIITKLKSSLSVPANLYLLSLYVVGTFIFILNLHWFPASSSDWVLIYALAATVLILNQITIPIPPEGNSLSMDSAVYMAT